MSPLLVNYVCFPPVGHTVEALRYALGYHLASSDYEISLVLNKHTAHKLAGLCPWISQVFTVDLPESASTSSVASNLIGHIPRSWDYIVSDPRSKTKEYCPDPFFSYYQLLDRYFYSRIARSYCGKNSRKEGILYDPNHQLKLKLPKCSLDFAQQKIINTKIKIGMLFAGAGDPGHNPALSSWKKIVDPLYKHYPDLSTYFFGKTESSGKETVTAGVTSDQVEIFLESYPNSVNCFDFNLSNQLALAKNCDVFTSPHTGFGFAVLSVGTPWITLSGTYWSEYFFNHVPFYSVLPDCSRYPCYGRMLSKCQKNLSKDEKVLCMNQKRIVKSQTEILRATQALIDKKWDYQTCLKNHFKRAKQHPGLSGKMYSFDDAYGELSE